MHGATNLSLAFAMDFNLPCERTVRTMIQLRTVAKVRAEAIPDPAEATPGGQNSIDRVGPVWVLAKFVNFCCPYDCTSPVGLSQLPSWEKGIASSASGCDLALRVDSGHADLSWGSTRPAKMRHNTPSVHTRE